MDFLSVVKLLEVVITIIIFPLLVVIFKISTKIVVIETTLNNRRNSLETIFKKLEENREDLHQVNLKTEKILSKLEKD